jgi:hypothetical protein
MLNFKKSVKDYRYLMEQGYSEKASLKLVGDRYRLSRLERNCLFRGVKTRSVARCRMEKLVDSDILGGANLGVDWYNVLITVESYLKGFPVFLSDDGLLRDASGIHGSYRLGKTGERAISLLLDRIADVSPSRLDIYLDSPIAYSGQMAVRLREILGGRDNCRVSVTHSVDYTLKRYPGIVASSDSAIIDRVNKVFDLPRDVLEKSFHFVPPDLTSLDRGNRLEPYL